MKIIENYFHPRADNKISPSRLKKQLDQIRINLMEILSINIDMEDFVNLIFFCEFDLEKLYLDLEGNNLSKKEKVQLRGMAPDRTFMEKHSLIRKAFFSKSKGTTNTKQESIITNDYNKIPTGMRSSRRINRFKSNQQAGLRNDEVEDQLGPIEDYLYLIDRTIFNNPDDDAESKTKGEKTLEFVKRLEGISDISSKIDTLLNNTEIDEKYLSDLLEQINWFYERLEMLDAPQIVKDDNFEKMEELKKNIVKRRNIASKQSLALSNDIDNKIRSGVTKYIIQQMAYFLAKKVTGRDYNKSNSNSILSSVNSPSPSKRILKRGKKKGQHNMHNIVHRQRINNSGDLSNENYLSPLSIGEKSHRSRVTDKRLSRFNTKTNENPQDLSMYASQSSSRRSNVKNNLNSGNNLSVKRETSVNLSNFSSAVKLLRKSNSNYIDEQGNSIQVGNQTVRNKSSRALINDPSYPFTNRHSQQVGSFSGGNNSSSDSSYDSLIDEASNRLIELEEQVAKGIISQEKFNNAKKIVEITKLKRKAHRQRKKAEDAVQSSESTDKFLNSSSQFETQRLREDIIKKEEENNRIEKLIKDDHRSPSKKEESSSLMGSDFNIKIKRGECSSNLSRDRRSENSHHNDPIQSDQHNTNSNHTEMKTLEEKIKEQLEEMRRMNLIVEGEGRLRGRELQKARFLTNINFDTFKTVHGDNIYVDEDDSSHKQVPKLHNAIFLAGALPEKVMPKVNIGNRSNFHIQQSRLTDSIKYSRVNNNIPFRLRESTILRDKIQQFILHWFSEKLELSESKVTELMGNKEMRNKFFARNGEFFDTFIDAISKNPLLSNKATDYVFKKEEMRLKEEEDKKKKEEVVEDRRNKLNEIRAKMDQFTKSRPILHRYASVIAIPKLQKNSSLPKIPRFVFGDSQAERLNENNTQRDIGRNMFKEVALQSKRFFKSTIESTTWRNLGKSEMSKTFFNDLRQVPFKNLTDIRASKLNNHR